MHRLVQSEVRVNLRSRNRVVKARHSEYPPGFGLRWRESADDTAFGTYRANRDRSIRSMTLSVEWFRFWIDGPGLTGRDRTANCYESR